MKFKKANVINIDEDKAQSPKSSKNQSLAMTKKNKYQETQAIKSMKRCGDAAIRSGVGPRAFVSLQVDYRTHYNPKGPVTIVYNVRKVTGSIKVYCQYCVSSYMMEQKATAGCLQISMSSKPLWRCYCHSWMILLEFAT